MGRRVVFLVLLIGAGLWPTSALAASGSLVNGVMNYTADGGESNNIVFTLDTTGSEPSFQLADAPAVQIQAQSPCFTVASNVMQCPVDGNGSGAITILTASLGDGNDTVTLVANLPTSIGAGGGADVMKGGPAADFLRGGQQDDTISGGSGDDQLVGDDPGTAGGGSDSLDGGDGSDTEDGQDGDDTVRGGNGNDKLTGSGGNDLFPAEGTTDGADDVSGGDGIDTASFSARTDPVQLSLDDQANDGVIGNAADNLHTDVENLVGGSGGDVLTGSAFANAINGGPGDDAEAGGDGSDALIGDTGNDALDGGAGADNLSGDSGNDALDGGAGPDVFAGGDGIDTGDYSARMAPVSVALDGVAGDGEFAEGDNVQPDVENLRGGGGADTFLGSAAGNTLDGGAGEDYSDGGAGSDTLVGGDAGDVLRSRGSSEPDTITCGPGPDFVIAKVGDVIAPDCDRADRGVNQKPKLRDSAIVAPASGVLQFSPAGIIRRAPLQDKVVVPLHTIVDTLAGAVKVTSSATSRKTQTIALQDGAFDITQTNAKLAVTQFALQGGDFTICPVATARKAVSAATAKKSSKTVRVLWAKGKGKFRTKGRYAAASIRGTRWQTVDRCDGTLIKVTQGVVAVQDLVKKKTVVVKAGHSYLAKAP